MKGFVSFIHVLKKGNKKCCSNLKSYSDVDCNTLLFDKAYIVVRGRSGDPEPAMLQ